MFIKRIGKSEAINEKYVDRIYTRKDETDEGIKYVVVAEVVILELDTVTHDALRIAEYDTPEEAEKAFNDLLKSLNRG